jgi:hypothetical protein
MHPLIQITNFPAHSTTNKAQSGTREEFPKFRPAKNAGIKVATFGFEPVQPFSLCALFRSYDID